MVRNFKTKAKKFIRKEGFYVVLFVCLFIIASVTIISYKISKHNELNSKSSNSNTNEEQLTQNDKNDVSSELPNAERVENNTSNNKQIANNNSKAKNESTSENSDTKAASANAVTEVKFNNPVEGTLGRKFSSTPIKLYETDDRVTYKTVNGIDIKAAIGTEVKSAADGVVESVIKDPGQVGVEDGVNVIILHANGLRTKYCNLDSNVLVKEGDKVTAGTIIGKIGSTATLFRDGFDEHLNLQVIDSNGEQVDPQKYFSYK